MLIDQHAAHERLRYDALAKAVEEGVASQRLLTPQIVRVSAREMTLVEENMDALTAAGYDISPIGDRDLQIRAVPHIHGHAELTPRFMDVISSLSGLGSAALEARRDEILQAACKGAVKAGDALSDSEITQDVEFHVNPGIERQVFVAAQCVDAVSYTHLIVGYISDSCSK